MDQSRGDEGPQSAPAAPGCRPEEPAAGTCPNRELTSLQHGRALAALLVAAFHLSILLKAASPADAVTFHAVTWWGFRGVDFFFVLSGFIILFAHRRDIGRRDRIWSYAAKRVSRIYPIYWLCTAAVLVLSWLGAGTALTSVASPGAALSTVTLIRFSDVEPPLGVAWTLFHEVAFYTMFGLLVLSRTVGLLALGAWLLSLAVMPVWPGTHDFRGVLFGLYNVNFVFGMLACLAYRRCNLRSAKLLMSAGLLLLCCMVYADSETGGSPIVHLGFAAGFACVVAGSSAIEALTRSSRLPLLKLIGDASYSLYLIHAVAQLYLLRALMKLGPAQSAPGWLLYAVVLALTVALGILVHLLLEKPSMALAKRLIGRGGGRF